MKKINNKVIYIFLVLTLFFSSCSLSSQKELVENTSLYQKMLVGKWYGKDKSGQIGLLIFNDDYSTKMVQKGMVLDGSSIGGKVTWELDEYKKPMHLNLVMNLNSGKTEKLLMIIKFIGKNKLQLQIGESSLDRPISFSKNNNENQMIFIRQN